MIYNGIDFNTYLKNYPNEDGYFGKYGGMYVDDRLKKAMNEITQAYFTICKSRKFIIEVIFHYKAYLKCFKMICDY